MIALAHTLATSCYIGAAALAAAPFVRRIAAPWRGVAALLAIGIAAHIAALVGVALEAGRVPLTGLGPALSFAGLVLAVTLLVVELSARDVSLTLVAGPLAALTTLAGAITGLQPLPEPGGVRGAWFIAHIALSFVGIAAFATSAAAGTLYLVERRELKQRRFGALFRFFPPLATLDRVNRLAAVGGWMGLTLGVVLAVSYSLAYQTMDLAQMVWGTGAWLSVSAVVLGRMVGGWQARRAALVSSIGFAMVVALYVAFRVAATGRGQFL